ncbi:hypothetical protein [Brevundimonas sp. UBA7664]|uniref:hypothetical protein n=1 Tax=Brevundimonas sp. UBA7664 TaxID=1946141 RepID=UPI0025C018A0|nr:hypothetical protein [Brevundimonas sp. UBA7664]
MNPSSAKAAFADIRPEGGADIAAARAEDRTRVARMLATRPADWSDEDIDLVAFKAMNTLGGPETYKWILPHFLERSVASPRHGWLIVSEVLAEKLDRAGFDDWPEPQRAAMLEMLAQWAAAQPGLFPGDPTYDPSDDAVLRQWIEART